MAGWLRAPEGGLLRAAERANTVGTAGAPPRTPTKETDMLIPAVRLDEGDRSRIERTGKAVGEVTRIPVTCLEVIG